MPVPPLVLQPLVENAVTHGVAHVLEGGVVRIRAEQRAASLVVTVDNPCDPDRPAGRGTGLGLRNVRERLESAYGGDALLRTEERDGRFVVTVEIPADRADARELMSETLRIVIVDDEPLARAVVREYAAGDPGIEIVADCANGFEAVKAVAELKPDLVLLDVQMPKLDGFEVLELLGRDQPVIFVTAYDQYALRAFEVHAVDYLLKPFSAERFQEAMQRARERMRAKAVAAARGRSSARPGRRPARPSAC